MRELLVRVRREPHELRLAKKYDRNWAYFGGLSRINLPWRDAEAIRLSVIEPQKLQIHVWKGDRGVTWRYYPDFHQTWAAYATTRSADQPRPNDETLWATSGDLYRRSGVGTVELHYREGRLALLRGDLVLACVPFDGPPAEVYLEGGGLLRGLAAVPSTWKPTAAEVPKPLLASSRPGELDWQVPQAKGVLLNRTAQGTVELVGEGKHVHGQADLVLADPTPLDIVLQIDRAEVGTGIQLADEQGRPLCRLALVRHRESGKTAFDLLHSGSTETERSYDPAHQPVPLAAVPHWFRLVAGAGVVKCFTSADGVSWSQAAPTAIAYDGRVARIGLYCLAADAQRDRAAVDCGPPSRGSGRRGPPGTDRARRRLACPKCVAGSLDRGSRSLVPPARRLVRLVVRLLRAALTGSAQSAVARVALDRLAQSVLEEGGPPDTLLRVMDEVALLYAPDDWSAMDRFVEHSERLGLALARQGCRTPFSTLSRVMQRWPIWHQRRLPVFSDVLLRHELTELAGRQQWNELRAVCTWVRFWNRLGRPRDGEQPPWSAHAESLVEWAEALVSAEEPRLAGDVPPARSGDVVVSALVERLSREAFNTMGEVRAAVASGAYRDACQLLSSAAAGDRLGLLPDAEDPRLHVSMSVAAEAMLRETAELRRAMQEHFGKIGRLRMNHAAAVGDAAATEALAVQFAGSELAAEAHGWLGDRYLSVGRFPSAVRHYRAALTDAAAAQREALAARLRLCGATSRPAGRTAPHNPHHAGLESILSRPVRADGRHTAGGAHVDFGFRRRGSRRRPSSRTLRAHALRRDRGSRYAPPSRAARPRTRLGRSRPGRLGDRPGNARQQPDRAGRDGPVRRLRAMGPAQRGRREPPARTAYSGAARCSRPSPLSAAIDQRRG